MADEAPPPPTFTSADRIRQLNDIDKDVAQLIHSAGLAIQALTNAKPESDSSEPENASLESHKKQFKDATSKYFALLSSIDVRLRRQVYALEEASVMEPDAPQRGDGPASGTAGGAGTGAGAGSTTTAGASNPLDISWLNSRKDTVGKDKEAELWAAAREFVTDLDQKPEKDTQSSGESEKMQLD